ncbi:MULTISPECIES: PrsW family intramembrane metalloprotease [unclassified Schaalia]|jgi:RsiW-degrading membrane proteinase PrsW (M82 family)|uniref:PrsW family intramembrane metalloprotease n=1 Tax=unclassified Schaalia TaxID=2691889 RepID=UPI0015F722F3|nr:MULTISPECIES: PrsW family intramembrane metalloprotease [unclassified Schaalia]
MTSSEPNPWERYRLSAQRSERQDEGHHLDSPSPYSQAQPSSDAKVGRFRTWWVARGLSTSDTVIVIAAVVGLIATSLVLFQSTGFVSTGAFGLIALLPLGIVAWVLSRSDALAPMPLRYLLFSAAWGAGVATAIAAAINTALFEDLIHYLGDVASAEVRAAVLVAPFSEEVLKGLGVVVILVVGRPYVVSLSNGVAVGGLAGAGFAFTENILYFAQAHAEGTSSLGVTIFARAVMSPFVHPLATSLIGIGVAAALLGPKGIWSRCWRGGVGWIAAIFVHAAWNGLASRGIEWLVWYILLEVPLFIVWLIWILRRPKKELPRIGQGLDPYVATGWLSTQELHMVCDAGGRKYARQWARKVGKPAPKALRGYMKNAGRLGLEQRQIENSGPSRPRTLVAQKALAEMIIHREAYLEAGQLAVEEGRIAGDD